MAILIDGQYTVSVVSSGGNPAYTLVGLGGAKTKRKRKGTQNVTINSSDPYGLVTAKITVTKYAVWNSALGHFESVNK
jgi:hypothetical protein